MKRFRLFRRSSRGGGFYCVDAVTGKHVSLGTKNPEEAERLLHAKNEAHVQPAINLQIAKDYLAASDPQSAKRKWKDAFQAIIDTKHGETKARWARAQKEQAFDLMRNLVILETQADHLIAVLKAGTVSTNVHLRKLYNFCVDLNWLPWPIIPKKQWPPVRYGEKRAQHLGHFFRALGKCTRSIAHRISSAGAIRSEFPVLPSIATVMPGQNVPGPA